MRVQSARSTAISENLPTTKSDHAVNIGEDDAIPLRLDVVDYHAVQAV